MAFGNLDTVAIAAAQTIVTTAETAVGVIAPGEPRPVPAGESIAVSGYVNLTLTGSTTAVVVRIRKGPGVAGTVVGTAKTTTVTASTNVTIPFGEVDTTPADNQQYTVTVVCTAAAANTTVNGGVICGQAATPNE